MSDPAPNSGIDPAADDAVPITTPEGTSGVDAIPVPPAAHAASATGVLVGTAGPAGDGHEQAAPRPAARDVIPAPLAVMPAREDSSATDAEMVGRSITGIGERPAPGSAAERPSWAPASGPGAVAAPVAPHRARAVLRSPAPIFGPPGRRRSVAVMVLLSIVTLGIYSLVWHHRINREMADFDPRMQVRSGRSVLALSVPLLLGLGVAAAAAARIILDHAGTTVSVPIAASITHWLVLAPLAIQYLVVMIPFSLLAVAMTAERVRVVEDHVGIPTDRQLAPLPTVAWLMFPIAGGLVVMARGQRRLNEIWELMAG
jgi:hypothetical protein